jgi:hypothetical protein
MARFRVLQPVANPIRWPRWPLLTRQGPRPGQRLVASTTSREKAGILQRADEDMTSLRGSPAATSRFPGPKAPPKRCPSPMARQPFSGPSRPFITGPTSTPASPRRTECSSLGDGSSPSNGHPTRRDRSGEPRLDRDAGGELSDRCQQAGFIDARIETHTPARRSLLVVLATRR